MLRISGIAVPAQKHICIALTSIKGVGRPLARKILEELKVNPTTKTQDLTPEQESLIRVRVERETIEGDLGRKVSMDIKRLQDIGTWRGNRHRRKMPVRGQTSRRNARTKRGKRKTGLSGRVTLTKT